RGLLVAQVARDALQLAGLMIRRVLDEHLAGERFGALVVLVQEGGVRLGEERAHLVLAVGALLLLAPGLLRLGFLARLRVGFLAAELARLDRAVELRGDDRLVERARPGGRGVGEGPIRLSG